MWRHSLSECLQVGLLRLGCFTAVGQSPLIVGVLVSPLATGHQLDTAKNQVERVCPGVPEMDDGNLVRHVGQASLASSAAVRWVWAIIPATTSPSTVKRRSTEVVDDKRISRADEFGPTLQSVAVRLAALHGTVR